MELCRSKVRLAPLYRNLVNGVADPEITYFVSVTKLLDLSSDWAEKHEFWQIYDRKLDQKLDQKLKTLYLSVFFFKL